MPNVSEDPSAVAAVASAASALREVRAQASGLHSDDQASVFDKVIHMQRQQLAQLQKEKAQFAQEREEYQSKIRQVEMRRGSEKATNGPSDPPAAQRSGKDETFLTFKFTKRQAGILAIIVVVLAMALRTQRTLNKAERGIQSWDIQVERNQMEKLITDLMRDKALLVKEKRDGVNGTKSGRWHDRQRSMDRHLATVQKILGGMHQKHVNAQGSQSNKLMKENEALAAELKDLKHQIAQLRPANASAQTAVSGSRRP
mmetsp:Transcript_34589/g.53989  ORF Transcript_34589/g.53989 Transcript_34589/m.53989 type:complete len:257 (+) Transcript_34589:685-1455(+)